MVADLFAFTKLEYLEPTLCRAPLDLGLLLHRRPVGDEHVLRRVVENLLDNALRHTPRSGAILVDWHCEPDRVVFSVVDSGSGIAPTDMPYLLDPLYRGEVSRNRQIGGAGLGLAIARRALRAHGGELSATNRETGGAQFSAWLPLPAGSLA